MVSPNNRDLSGPERELSSVTAEMIEAGRVAYAQWRDALAEIYRLADAALQETSNNGISAWSEADFEDRFK